MYIMTSKVQRDDKMRNAIKARVCNLWSIILFSADGGYIPKNVQPESSYYSEPPYHTVPQVAPQSVSAHRSSIDSWTDPDMTSDGWSSSDLLSHVRQSPSGGTYCSLQQAGNRNELPSGTIDIKPTIQAATLAGYSGEFHWILSLHAWCHPLFMSSSSTASSPTSMWLRCFWPVTSKKPGFTFPLPIVSSPSSPHLHISSVLHCLSSLFLKESTLGACSGRKFHISTVLCLKSLFS